MENIVQHDREVYLDSIDKEQGFDRVTKKEI